MVDTCVSSHVTSIMLVAVQPYKLPRNFVLSPRTRGNCVTNHRTHYHVRGSVSIDEGQNRRLITFLSSHCPPQTSHLTIYSHDISFAFIAQEQTFRPTTKVCRTNLTCIYSSLTSSCLAQQHQQPSICLKLRTTPLKPAPSSPSVSLPY